MAAELITLNPDQHQISFVPKLTTDLPFFNLTSKRKDIPRVIKYQATDEEGRTIHWEVHQNTSKEIGPPGVEAHLVWVLLVKPCIDAHRTPGGRIPDVIPLGGIRECLRKVGWTAGGRQARRLIRVLTQISFAGCIADLWLPTGTADDSGNDKYLHIQGRFSKMEVYKIGERHISPDDPTMTQYDFDLDDSVYIKLAALEVKLQEAQDQRPQDNQYLFSVGPASRRWYELMSAKIFGVVKNKGVFCEIRYSWYIQHHHTLKRLYHRFRVVEQMNRVVQDHLDSGYLNRVEYRAIKEPDQEIDYIIRYYPGIGATDSILRIRHHLSGKRSKTKPTQLARDAADVGEWPVSSDKEVAAAPAAWALITERQAQDEQLLTQLFRQFGITLVRAFDLINNDRTATAKQLEYWPHRNIQIKAGLAGWMIAAIERNYAPPPGFAEAIQRQKEVAAAEFRLALIASCSFCDKHGFIQIETPGSGHRTVRICTHNPTIERPDLPGHDKLNKGATRQNAKNGLQRDGKTTDEENSARPVSTP
jgi:hypothetical protein